MAAPRDHAGNTAADLMETADDYLSRLHLYIEERGGSLREPTVDGNALAFGLLGVGYQLGALNLTLTALLNEVGS